MSKKRPKAEVGDELFYATIDALWRGQRLSKASVVVEKYFVVDVNKNGYHLNKPCSLLDGGTFVTNESHQDHELRLTPDEAVLALYSKVCRRVAVVSNNEAVKSGHISEAAAILEGIN
jgi:hypothetical protein